MSDFTGKLKEYYKLQEEVKVKMTKISKAIIEVHNLFGVDKLKKGRFMIGVESIGEYVVYEKSVLSDDLKLISISALIDNGLDVIVYYVDYKKENLCKIIELYHKISEDGKIKADKLIKEENETVKQLEGI